MLLKVGSEDKETLTPSFWTKRREFYAEYGINNELKHSSKLREYYTKLVKMIQIEFQKNGLYLFAC